MLVGFIVNRMDVPQEDIDDLFQEGALGLMNAAMNYDNTRAKFVTFAHYCITNRIRHYLQRGNTVAKHAVCIAPNPDSDSDLFGMIPAEGPSPDEQVEIAHMAQYVKDILDNYDDRDADMVRAHYLDGESQTSISMRLGISQPLVSRQIRKTITRLRRQLKEDNS